MRFSKAPQRIQVATLAAVISVLCFSGCDGPGINSNSPSDSQSLNHSDTAVKPSNVEKVLNRVQCQEVGENCNQETYNILWSACLEQGYQETAPSGNVSAARDIREMVSKSIIVPVQKQVYYETTDENGIVTAKSEDQTVNEERIIKGYCIGSEYITG